MIRSETARADAGAIAPSVPPPAFSLESPTGKRRRAKGQGATRIPTDFAVSRDIEVMCRTEGLPNPHVVFRDFRDWALKKGATYVDWEAAFRTWMRSPITRRDYPAWADEPVSRPLAPRKTIEVTPEQEERFNDPAFDPTSLFEGLGKQ